ncbi:BTB/POZ and TAZ domain-containing protein [Salix suchowensis]|nr:BTB/POZ and TAZ domain-containing protein [Salix suchowensis]
MASQVMKGMLKQAKGRGRRRSISIHGVPHDAVRVFIRLLYSSCCEKEEMEDYVLHLLVLSHVFVVPSLKQICIQQLEHGFLTSENVVDIFQLALLCDAPRLSHICHRMILKNFQEISITEGWKVMKKCHPALEKALMESLVDEENMQRERTRRSNERKIYLQLYEAMEALVHICRDGCQTIGPHDKDFRDNQAPCNYSACKGLEMIVRHFASCKLRVPGGCIHCKRMWQLLELHSRLCVDSEACRVPLCRNFKERTKKQSKKDEIKWRILVKNILKTKSIGGSPFFSSAFCMSP